MSLRGNSNLTTVTLSDVKKSPAALPAVGDVVTAANLEKGAVVLTDMGLQRLDNAAYTALASTAKVFIVQGKGANQPLLKSPALTKGSISISTSKHKPAVQQITVIGYNGTSGTLPSANDTSYFVKIRKNDNDAANRSQPMSLFGQFKTDSTATVTEVAFGLAENIVRNFKDEPANGYLSVEVLSDGTANTLAATLAVTTGSPVATYSAAHGLAVGDFVFIKGATFKVKVVVSTTVVTLSTPFVGTSETALATGVVYATDHGTLTSIAATGLRLSGVASDFDVNAWRDYYANRFTATFSDDSALVTSVQGARNGNGVWQQVAMDEYMGYGFEGQMEMMAVPPKPRDQEVKIPGIGANLAVDCKYSAIQLGWTEDIRGLVSMAGAEGSHLIYLNLEDVSGLGKLDNTANTGSELATALGLTPSDLNE